jgi:hypothetical protein
MQRFSSLSKLARVTVNVQHVWTQCSLSQQEENRSS